MPTPVQFSVTNVVDPYNCTTNPVTGQGLPKYGNQVPPYTNTRKSLRMVLDRYYKYKAEEARVRPKGRRARTKASTAGSTSMKATARLDK